MTKKKRIAKLEAEIERLWAHHAAHMKRIELLEAGVGHTVKVDADGWVVWDATLSRCTCGTSAVCPIHGPIHWSTTVYPADILPGTADERIS